MRPPAELRGRVSGVRTGFTLIEVLVVVAIIAVLIAILIPALTEARDQARSAKCLANTRDMGTGINTFAAAHRSRFQVVANISPTNTNNNPTGSFDLSSLGDSGRTLYAYESGTSTPTPNLLGWPVVLAREAGSRSLRKNVDWGVVGPDRAKKDNPAIRKFTEVLSCPADEYPINTFGLPSSTGADEPAKYVFGYLSYGINVDIVGTSLAPPAGRGVWSNGSKSGSPGAKAALRGWIDKVVRPSEVVVLADAGVGFKNADLLNQAGAPTLFGTGDPAAGIRVRGPLLEYVDRSYRLKLRPERHRRNRLNLTFADGHGAPVQRILGNPLYDGGEQLPNWRYLPKVRVSPHEVGTYPGPLDP
ncbi:MAG: prepilin-type N-terminal cleavage/methylation domain-containing protein [Planctomycetes bacterium]|nr:prepilin-type N-terminal cleavage/methylation domain-containing protein [Planctomycetota bacterium]